MKLRLLINEIARLMEMQPEDLSLDSPLEQFSNWDSLTAISTVALIDNELGVLLNVCEFQQCKTLKEIFDLVDSVKNSAA